MKGLSKKLILMFMCAFVLMTSIQVLAISDSESYNYLLNTVTNGTYYLSDSTIDYTDKQYKCSGGGYKYYNNLVDINTFINETQFQTLTAGAKQDFLKDMISLANEVVYACENGNDTNGVSDETVNDMLDVVQQKSGMGSQLLATLLADTKPDYATASRIYKPFSGPVSTVLGFFSIIILALLGVQMAMDIAYIVLPMFQLMIDGNGDGGDGKSAKGLAKIISVEARNAVRSAEDSGGGSGQNGSGGKLAIGIYFGKRWKGLTVLAICLLYLVGGNIYSGIAWFIDLFSGFLGF